MRGGLKGGLGRPVVAETIAARVRGVASEERSCGVVVVGGFLHRWARPGQWVATCKGLIPSRPDIGTPGGHVTRRTPLPFLPPSSRVCSKRLTLATDEGRTGRHNIYSHRAPARAAGEKSPLLCGLRLGCEPRRTAGCGERVRADGRSWDPRPGLGMRLGRPHPGPLAPGAPPQCWGLGG